MIQVIIEEMCKGNFSFPILVVGAVQLVMMIINYRLLKKNEKKDEINKATLSS